MPIDTEALVDPLIHELCDAEPDGACICRPSAPDDACCERYEAQARAAIAYLLPLIVERCATIAVTHAAGHEQSLGAYGPTDKDGGRGRQEGHIHAGETIASAIRALIPAKEANHA